MGMATKTTEEFWTLIDEGTRMAVAARELTIICQGLASGASRDRSSLARVLRAEAGDKLEAAGKILITLNPRPVKAPKPPEPEEAVAEEPIIKRGPGRPRKKDGLLPEPVTQTA